MKTTTTMTPRQFDEITKWQKETFPQATALSKVSHLDQEVRELNDAIVGNDEIGWKSLTAFLVKWTNKHQPKDTNYNLHFWLKQCKNYKP